MFQSKTKASTAKKSLATKSKAPAVQSSAPVYDAVIIGSGAAGGTAAQVLVEAGLNVVMLEAGPLRKNMVDFSYHDPFPYEDPYRGSKSESPSDEMRKKYIFGPNAYAPWPNPDEPYTTPKDTPFEWMRARNVGGRTMFWGRFANRYNEADFKMRSRDGMGLDWPIEYKDIAPYYDKAEIFMGVCGAKENHPDLPDADNFLPPVALKCSDHLLWKAAEKIGIRAMRVRRAMLTKSYRPPGSSLFDKDIAQCHYCADCDSGCETHSFYNSAFRQVVPLMTKYPKRFTLIPNAMARVVTVNKKGLADGVAYIDKTTGQEREIKARTVLLGCGTLETTRLLLLSNIANSSGQIGKNFMEHLDLAAQAYLPDLSFADREAGDGIGGSHIIIPWFGYFRPNEKRDFVRGFQIEPSVRQRMRPDKNPKQMAGFGQDFKKEVRRWQGTRVSLACHGEMLPSPNKFVEIDNTTKDKWGIPVLKIHYKWDDNDLNMFKYARRSYEEIFAAAKAVDVRLPKNPDPAGHSIHEMGTAHMGSDPKTSVLNKFNQSWDVKNLFVLDAAAFSSGTHKNPTLMIMALSWRAAEYLLDEMKKKNL
ncbi:MAG: GMC family oxidoreductase [Acidobacteria bacterium]|nr:GMC family oxidoreductase [Acidobacteriota bacterium]